MRDPGKKSGPDFEAHNNILKNHTRLLVTNNQAIDVYTSISSKHLLVVYAIGSYDCLFKPFYCMESVNRINTETEQPG
jgi:hypothetical protein